MATEFIMPRLPDQQQINQHSPQYYYSQQNYHHHQSHSQSPVNHVPQQRNVPQPPSQQISPLSTSNNNSPPQSSPMSHHAQRLRPIFMPAVLRPNEYPSRNTPKKSEGGDDEPRSPSSSLLSFNSWGALGRMTRRSTGDSGKVLDDSDSAQMDLDLFRKPTAEPTRNHWKPDPEAIHCDEPSCMRNFGYLTRRHHCRKCGNIFCDWHSAYGIPLDENADYNPRGTPSRACSHCFEEFKTWCSRTNSQASSENSSVVTGSQTAPSSPMAATPTAVKGVKGNQAPNRKEVAQSVPRDWNWSTF